MLGFFVSFQKIAIECCWLQNVLSFWIKRGVDGFRVDAINTLFENHYDRDEPRSALTDALPVCTRASDSLHSCSDVASLIKCKCLHSAPYTRSSALRAR